MATSQIGVRAVVACLVASPGDGRAETVTASSTPSFPASAIPRCHGPHRGAPSSWFPRGPIGESQPACLDDTQIVVSGWASRWRQSRDGKAPGRRRCGHLQGSTWKPAYTLRLGRQFVFRDRGPTLQLDVSPPTLGLGRASAFAGFVWGFL